MARPNRKKTAHHARKESYNQILRGVQSELNAPEKAFSKVVHQPFVERLSDIVGVTIARPHSILFGSILACIITATLYWLARYNGFALSGFETIGAFAIGWLLGLLYDALRAIFRKRQSS